MSDHGKEIRSSLPDPSCPATEQSRRHRIIRAIVSRLVEGIHWPMLRWKATFPSVEGCLRKKAATGFIHLINAAGALQLAPDVTIRDMFPTPVRSTCGSAWLRRPPASCSSRRELRLEGRIHRWWSRGGVLPDLHVHAIVRVGGGGRAERAESSTSRVLSNERVRRQCNEYFKTGIDCVWTLLEHSSAVALPLPPAVEEINAARCSCKSVSGAESCPVTGGL